MVPLIRSLPIALIITSVLVASSNISTNTVGHRILTKVVHSSLIYTKRRSGRIYYGKFSESATELKDFDSFQYNPEFSPAVVATSENTAAGFSVLLHSSKRVRSLEYKMPKGTRFGYSQVKYPSSGYPESPYKTAFGVGEFFNADTGKRRLSVHVYRKAFRSTFACKLYLIKGKKTCPLPPIRDIPEARILTAVNNNMVLRRGDKFAVAQVDLLGKKVAIAILHIAEKDSRWELISLPQEGSYCMIESLFFTLNDLLCFSCKDPSDTRKMSIRCQKDEKSWEEEATRLTGIDLIPIAVVDDRVLESLVLSIRQNWRLTVYTYWNRGGIRFGKSSETAVPLYDFSKFQYKRSISPLIIPGSTAFDFTAIINSQTEVLKYSSARNVVIKSLNTDIINNNNFIGNNNVQMLSIGNFYKQSDESLEFSVRIYENSAKLLVCELMYPNNGNFPCPSPPLVLVFGTLTAVYNNNEKRYAIANKDCGIAILHVRDGNEVGESYWEQVVGPPMKRHRQRGGFQCSDIASMFFDSQGLLCISYLNPLDNRILQYYQDQDLEWHFLKDLEFIPIAEVEVPSAPKVASNKQFQVLYVNDKVPRYRNEIYIGHTSSKLVKVETPLYSFVYQRRWAPSITSSKDDYSVILSRNAKGLRPRKFKHSLHYNIVTPMDNAIQDLTIIYGIGEFHRDDGEVYVSVQMFYQNGVFSCVIRGRSGNIMACPTPPISSRPDATAVAVNNVHGREKFVFANSNSMAVLHLRRGEGGNILQPRWELLDELPIEIYNNGLQTKSIYFDLSERLCISTQTSPFYAVKVYCQDERNLWYFVEMTEKDVIPIAQVLVEANSQVKSEMASVQSTPQRSDIIGPPPEADFFDRLTPDVGMESYLETKSLGALQRTSKHWEKSVTTELTKRYKSLTQVYTSAYNLMGLWYGASSETAAETPLSSSRFRYEVFLSPNILADAYGFGACDINNRVGDMAYVIVCKGFRGERLYSHQTQLGPSSIYDAYGGFPNLLHPKLKVLLKRRQDSDVYECSYEGALVEGLVQCPAVSIRAAEGETHLVTAVTRDPKSKKFAVASSISKTIAVLDFEVKEKLQWHFVDISTLPDEFELLSMYYDYNDHLCISLEKMGDVKLLISVYCLGKGARWRHMEDTVNGLVPIAQLPTRMVHKDTMKIKKLPKSMINKDK